MPFIADLGGCSVARIDVVVVWKVDNGHLGHVVAAKKGRAIREVIDWRNDRHARQARIDRLDVCIIEAGAIGPIVFGVSAIVIDDYDINPAAEERPDGVVLVSLPTIDKEKCFCARDEGRGIVVVEWIRVDGEINEVGKL